MLGFVLLVIGFTYGFRHHAWNVERRAASALYKNDSLKHVTEHDERDQSSNNPANFASATSRRKSESGQSFLPFGAIRKVAPGSHEADTSGALQHALTDEGAIGRAWCRERVCK